MHVRNISKVLARKLVSDGQILFDVSMSKLTVKHLTAEVYKVASVLELRHDKANRVACVPHEDLDQSLYPPTDQSLCCVLKS